MVNVGDYSDPSNLPVGTEVAFIGRFVSSSAYSNTTNSRAWNGLTIPVVSLTSYVSRDSGNRWAWHSASTVVESAVGSETSVTAAGSSVLGATAGATDFYIDGARTGNDINALGGGSLGDGVLLAEGPNSSIVAASWDAGDSFGGTVDGATPDTAGGDRLLFNLNEPILGGAVNDDRIASLDPAATLTSAGVDALVSAIDSETPLTVVPEPSTSLLGAFAVGLAMIRRRR